MLNEHIKHKLRHNLFRTKDLLKWIILSAGAGTALGLLGAGFFHGIRIASAIRTQHPLCLLLLPVGAVIILAAYRFFGKDASGGTNLVLLAIQSGSHIPLRMSPLIFFSTILSHLAGASVGREGAALQIGGSIGDFLGEKLKLNSNDKRTMIMVGMSSAFSAMLGTPIAASIFSLEVVSVGIMQYGALLPCVIGSYVARFVAEYLGVPSLHYKLDMVPSFHPFDMLIIFGLALCAGIVSVIFCAMMHRGEFYCRHIFKSDYIRALALGSMVLLVTFFIGDQTYNGTGADYIRTCVNGGGYPAAFIIKIVLTSFSILAGYKGGEIVPSFFIGASLGSVYGELLGVDISLSAALGMAGVFCGVTNCPITSLLIFCELFGFDTAPYALLMCAVCYIVSGYYGLYTGQKILYSKFRSNYINKKTE